MTPRDIILRSFLTLLVLAGGIATGLVGITYPVVVDNSALKSPIEVIRIDEHQMELADGRVVTFPGGDPDHELGDKIAYGKNRVELEGDPGDPQVWVYGCRKTLICGTPWAQPIRIPIIPNRIPRNSRVFITAAEVTRTPERPAAPSPALSNP